MTDVRYKPDCAKAKITQFEFHEGRVQESLDCISRRTVRLKAGTDRIRDQLTENIQLGLHKLQGRGFAALKTPTTMHRGRLVGSINTAVNNITDGLRAPIETVEVLRGPSANGNQIPSLLSCNNCFCFVFRFASWSFPQLF